MSRHFIYCGKFGVDQQIKNVFVGTGVPDRPLIQHNLRTVREAGPYTHKFNCE
jgi:hypothetical protein